MSARDIVSESEVQRDRASLALAFAHLDPTTLDRVLDLVSRDGSSAIKAALTVMDGDNPDANFKGVSVAVASFIGGRNAAWVEKHMPVAIALGLLSLSDDERNWDRALISAAVERLGLTDAQAKEAFGNVPAHSGLAALIGRALESPGTLLAAGLIARVAAAKVGLARVPRYGPALAAGASALAMAAEFFGLAGLASSANHPAALPPGVEVLP